ncbi:hypothetical protein GGR52DRAFT_590160 [Hypoxylon sp. FL1284]|nr:hypothetical protein GGR52DRAFT_590160 [Hypoxylon sp. FL1284]
MATLDVTAAVTTMAATATIVGRPGAHRPRDGLYRARNLDENSPWQRQPRGPRGPSLANTTGSRHAYGGGGGQPLYYYPTGIHQHCVHHSGCADSQCHYRAFLTDSIGRYNAARRSLRRTYAANLAALRRAHATAAPAKPAAERDAEMARLYAYYVARVRDVFDEHRRDHRRLFGRDYLCWVPPDRSSTTSPASTSAQPSRFPSPACCGAGRGGNGGESSGSGYVAGGGDVVGVQMQGRTTTTVVREGGGGREKRRAARR